MKKKIILFMILVIIGILGTTLLWMKKNDKNQNIGNTISDKTKEQTINDILNMESYTAKIEVTVTSNKNQNKYLLTQKYHTSNRSVQEVIEPSSIKGLKMSYDGNNLKVENTSLKISTLFQNYPYVSNNFLWLNTFIEDYQREASSEWIENEKEYMMKVSMKDSSNKYAMHKSLSINKKTGKPIKLEVQDVNQKTTVYILYNEIEINSIKESDVLAFRLEKEKIEI